MVKAAILAGAAAVYSALYALVFPYSGPSVGALSLALPILAGLAWHVPGGVVVGVVTSVLNVALRVAMADDGALVTPAVVMSFIALVLVGAGTGQLASLNRRLKEAEHKLRAAHGEVERELEASRRDLVRAERLATAGTLAAGVGHELNNATTVLHGALDALRACAEAGRPPSEPDLRALESAVEHVTAHARELLRLGRPGPDHAERLDLREVVHATVGMLRAAGRLRGASLTLELPDEPVLVTVNRVRVEQVLVNLVANAADALEACRGSARVIHVRLCRSGDGRRAHCSVVDSGPGVPAERRTKIFDSYFSTKPPGRGTGLGLPVARQIVQSYGGTLQLECPPGGGACFRFDLPLAEEKPALARAG